MEGIVIVAYISSYIKHVWYVLLSGRWKYSYFCSGVVLVTGANGSLGAHVVDQALKVL